MSPSNPASSPGRPRSAAGGSGKAGGSGSGTDTRADDDTKPHTFTPERSGADDTKPETLTADEADDASVTSEQADPPTDAWAPRDRRQTVAAGPPPVTAYPAVAAFGAGTAAGSAGGAGYSPPAAPLTPPVSSVARTGGARRARLKVAHLGPLSVMRISLTFALCMFIVLLVAVAALWFVLDSSGVFKSIEDAANTLTDKERSGLANWLSFGRVMLVTVVLGAANVIAVTLLSTIGALLYNLCSDFVGGVEVTLVER